MVSVSVRQWGGGGRGGVRYLFYRPIMDEKIKTWPPRFPTKENPNMEKALFDWPIVLHYDIKSEVLVDFYKVLWA